MTTAAPDLHRLLTQVMRQDRGRLLAALIGALGDFDLAEEALADATESALVHWQRGLPDAPQGWLLRVARRKAIDRIRRAGRLRARLPDLTLLAQADEAAMADPTPEIPDDRLRLIFTCCHPGLDRKSSVALTLRTIGGLTTPEIARAFLDQEATMGQRISRAKAKIAAAGIPYVVPGPDILGARLSAVLAVIYLIFNEGYAASSGETQTRVDLCDEAIWLARMLADLMPDEAEPKGLLALLLTTHARRPARSGVDGALVPLPQQDRALWDGALVAEGVALLDTAIRAGKPGPYQIKAAMSALHVQVATYAETDWPQMLRLYDALLGYEPSDIVRLNRAVALSETGALAAALADLDAVADRLDGYQSFHAAQAHLLARAGQTADAVAAFDRAIAMSGTAAERKYLSARRRELAHRKKNAGHKARRSPTGR